MNLADRLAAARAAGMTQDEAERAAALLMEDVREPGEGLPAVDHDVPAALSPVDSALAAANAAGGKRAPRVRPTVRTAERRQGVAPRPPGCRCPRTPRRPRARPPPPRRAGQHRQRSEVNLDTAARRGVATQNDRIEELKSSVHVQLLQQMGPRLYDSDMDQNELDTEVRKVLADVLGSQDRPLSSSDRARVTQEISDDILGYGPIEPFLRDPDVSEVMVNGAEPGLGGEGAAGWSRPTRTSPTRRTCAAPSTRSSAGSADASTSRARWSTPACPTAAASTPSSRRSPWTAPSLTIRKFATDPLTVQDLINFGSLST